MLAGLENIFQILHEKVYDEVLSRISSAYKQVKIGDPLDRKQLAKLYAIFTGQEKIPNTKYHLKQTIFFSESVLCGPVHSEKAVEMYTRTLEDVTASGGKINVGGKVNIKFFLHVL